MKIVKLSSENVKRLHAVHVTPEGALVKVGGKNGAGKSSVLDSIAYALGGQSLVPSEPIRKGETQAKIEVDLGDIVVTRKFTKKDGVTGSTLVVKSKDGAVYPSPQAVLDKLLGKLTFDPLEFSRAFPKFQRQTLAQLVGADTSLLDAKRQAAFDRRTQLTREKKVVEAQLAALPIHADVPEEEISIAGITTELGLAEELSKTASKEHEKLTRDENNESALQTAVDSQDRSINETIDQIRALEKKLATSREQSEKLAQQYNEAAETLKKQQVATRKATAKIPDTAALRALVTEAEVTNRKVRANRTRDEHFTRAQQLGEKILDEVENILAAEAEKSKFLASLEYPVPGLGISEEGVTFGGNPFDQASTSEQLRTSVAIGLALNPKLKVLLVRNGNALDQDSLKAMAEQAEKADAQVWVEWVSETADGVSVMIADGEVV